MVQTEQAQDGAVLAHDVFGGPTGTIPLLREGVKLDVRYRKALLAAGIPRIAVEDAETEGIQVRPVVTPGARLEAQGRLSKLLGATKQSFGRVLSFFVGTGCEGSRGSALYAIDPATLARTLLWRGAGYALAWGP